MASWKSRLQARLFALLLLSTAWQPAAAQSDTTNASLDLFT